MLKSSAKKVRKVYKNEILGIIGESGSGKSTLAKILLQIIK